MLVACTSDIHVNISEKNRRATQLLIETLSELDPDVFVFAGDVSSETNDVEGFFGELSSLRIPKLFVCGNHDIWISKDKQNIGYNSYAKYYCDMKELCEKHGILYLAKEPIIIRDIAFVGTIGWYDYSTRNESLDHLFTMTAYESKRSSSGIWNDGERAYWPKDPEVESTDWRFRRRAVRMTDQDVSRMLCNDLGKQLQKIEGKVKQAVAVTHTVPFKELVRYTGDPSFDFFSAFIGCVELGKTILDSRYVTHCICGHTHFPDETEINSVKCICSPIGYLHDFEGDLNEYLADNVRTFRL